MTKDIVVQGRVTHLETERAGGLGGLPVAVEAEVAVLVASGARRITVSATTVATVIQIIVVHGNVRLSGIVTTSDLACVSATV